MTFIRPIARLFTTTWKPRSGWHHVFSCHGLHKFLRQVNSLPSLTWRLSSIKMGDWLLNLGKDGEADLETLSLSALPTTGNHISLHLALRYPPSSPGLLRRGNLPTCWSDRHGSLKDRCWCHLHLDRCRRIQLWVQRHRVRLFVQWSVRSWLLRCSSGKNLHPRLLQFHGDPNCGNAFDAASGRHCSWGH